ncbi:peroxiredoxin-like family protein [Nocardia sp. XZ_19_385]|uniref:peroxiredoxin-like family protein n=1 Tax=Nocardia sp. XZ_19_385 TaxID=2769488 RepID=UPI0018905F8C|nr:peroxiredoxin-like family protein [Nocardia sp. XZ_19_385]
MTRVDVIANERLLTDRHYWREFQEFWQDKPVALVFLRQFGSAFALQQAQKISAHYDEITAAGGDVVFIGLGTPIQAFTFRQKAKTRFTVLATNDQTLYRTMGLWRAVLGTIGPRNLVPFVHLLRNGVYPAQRTGDNAQLGGAFVVAAGGKEVVWDFRAHRASDIPPTADIVAALRAASKVAAA